MQEVVVREMKIVASIAMQCKAWESDVKKNSNEPVEDVSRIQAYK